MYDNPYMNTYNPYLRSMQAPQTPQQIIRVTGLDGAKAYQMVANSSVALFDENEDIFYIKSTDGAGFPTIRTFKFETYVEEQKVPAGNYVTREEFEELKGLVDDYGKQLIRKQERQSNEFNGSPAANDKQRK